MLSDIKKPKNSTTVNKIPQITTIQKTSKTSLTNKQHSTRDRNNSRPAEKTPAINQRSKKKPAERHIQEQEANSRKRTVITPGSIKSVHIKTTDKEISESRKGSHQLLTRPEGQHQLTPEKSIAGNSAIQPIPLRPLQQPTTINTAHVAIETSLFLDGWEAGLSKEVILQLTEIFAWDIDFATNLRPGDQFTVVYGKKMVDGRETDTDEIVAAEFVNQGNSYIALRYVDKLGAASYYTPEGQSMQRAFLSTPVDFIKISSPFDMHRKHPILNRIRAHKGIDYAARTGTPVKTTGDGTISFSGHKGAYGLAIVIQHNDHYETLYAHLSEVKKGLTVGEHVKQGDIIGFVGQSGLATGPHLHYEFHVDGIYRDPETVKVPHSMPISDELLTDFNTQTQAFLAQLNEAKNRSMLVKNHPEYHFN